MDADRVPPILSSAPLHHVHGGTEHDRRGRRLVLLRRQGSGTGAERRARVRARSPAHGNHAPSQPPVQGPSVRVRQHVSGWISERLPLHVLARAVPRPHHGLEATDGQHGARVGYPAGGRGRREPAQLRREPLRAVAVHATRDRVSQVLRFSRLRRRRLRQVARLLHALPEEDPVRGGG